MNKNAKRIVCILCLFFLLLIFVIPTYAISEEISCANDHFSKLKTTGSWALPPIVYRTPPSEKSCPYVAISLLLTFYDTYWHDDFVPDEYHCSNGDIVSLDWQQGVYYANGDRLYETFAPTVEAQDWKDYVAENYPEADIYSRYPYYRTYAIQNEENFLEPYLIGIGTSLNLHPDPDDTLGLSEAEYFKDVLEEYLFLQGMDSVVNVFCWEEKDGYDIESKMRQVLTKGSPVIYIGFKVENAAGNIEESNNDNSIESESLTNKVGHALVAYGIDENDNILFHTGWSGDEHKESNNMPYQYNRAIIWLEINESALPHGCSDNYVDSFTNEPICACQIYESHPKHNDTHNTNKFYGENYEDDTKGWSECYGCGETVNVHYHDFEPSNYSESEHKLTCNVCGYEKFESHEYETDMNGIRIWSECSCGDIIVHYHSFEYIDLENGQHISVCTECPYFMVSNHEYSPSQVSSSTYHEGKCVCGHTNCEPEPHAPSRYQSISNFKHNILCACGYVMGSETHSIVTDGPLKSHCTDCGAVFNTGSDIIIKRKEDELYTE